MGKYSRLGKNTLLVLLGNAGSKLIGLIMLPLYTRWLTVGDYGLTDVLNVYVSLLISVVSCCIGESLFIFPKDTDDKQKKEYYSSGVAFLVIMMVLTAVVFFILDKFSQYNFIRNSFFDNIWLIYSMIACMLSQQVIQQFTRSLDKMTIYSMTGIVVTLATAGFAFVFIPKYGVYGYVVSINIAYLCGTIYSFAFSGSYKYLNFRCITIERCKEMLRYSIPLIPNGIMWWLVGALNRPVMELNVGLEGIGLYAVANKFPGIITMLFTVFCTSWQISVIEEYGKDGFEQFYNKVFRFVTIFLFCILIFITLSSKGLITIFTTSNYYGAWVFVPLLTLGALLSSISSMGGMVFSAEKQSKYYFYSSIWGALTAVIANIILIPLCGILGAALSPVLSFFVMAVSRNIYAWKYVHLLQISRYFVMMLIAIASVISPFLFQSSLAFYTLNCVFLFFIVFINLDLKEDFKIALNRVVKAKLNR